jgi:hypothetical protein
VSAVSKEHKAFNFRIEGAPASLEVSKEHRACNFID